MDEQIKILEEMKNEYLRKADALDVAIRQLREKKKSTRKSTVKHTEQFFECPQPNVPFPVQSGGGIRTD